MTTSADPGTALRSLYDAEGGVAAIFSGRVADYSAFRPDYPDSLFDTLKTFAPPAPDVTVADVGAGTGLLTQGLLRHGYRVTAIEPNTQMRQAADERLGTCPGYHSTSGLAESLPFDSESVGLITAAQAFHWFDVERARVEFLRVLDARGQVAIIWNDRTLDDPLNAALDEMFDRYGSVKRAGLRAHDDRSAASRLFAGSAPRELAFPHAQRLDRQGLLGLVFSRSYVPARDTDAGRRVAAEVGTMFDRFAQAGMAEVRYRTGAMVGRPAPACLAG